MGDIALEIVVKTVRGGTNNTPGKQSSIHSMPVIRRGLEPLVDLTCNHVLYIQRDNVPQRGHFFFFSSFFIDLFYRTLFT